MSEFTDGLRQLADFLDDAPLSLARGKTLDPYVYDASVSVLCSKAVDWWEWRDVLGPDAEIHVGTYAVRAARTFGGMTLNVSGPTAELCEPAPVPVAPAPALKPRPLAVSA